MSQQWSIRPPTPDDLAFIYSSWLKSYKHDSLLGKSVRTTVYFENYREVLDRLLATSSVLVACISDEPSVILGYLVHEDSIAHYCFVKESFRRMGIGASLLEYAHLTKKLVQFTHATGKLFSMLDMLVLCRGYNIEYNPFLLYNKTIE